MHALYLHTGLQAARISGWPCRLAGQSSAELLGPSRRMARKAPELCSQSVARFRPVFGQMGLTTTPEGPWPDRPDRPDTA